MTRLPALALLLVPWLSSAALAQKADVVVPRDDPATAEARVLARTVSDFYRDGRRDAAEGFAKEHPRVVAFDDAKAHLGVSAAYREWGGGGSLEITITRSPASADAPLVVSVPPGSYGAAPGVQDVGLLRAPVIVLRSGETRARTMVPVACASFFSEGPAADAAFTLTRFTPGSSIDKLMVALCSGDEAPEQGAQLAIWVVRNGITRDDLSAQPFVCTFEHRLPVGAAIAPRAEAILRQAGLDPKATRFFNADALEDGEGRPAPEPQAEPAPMPVPEPGSNLS